jgi:enoyl-CoA hydratase/carnithine racemase
MEQALAVADHIAGLPPLAVRMVKESMNRGQDIPTSPMPRWSIPTASWCSR